MLKNASVQGCLLYTAEWNTKQKIHHHLFASFFLFLPLFVSDKQAYILIIEQRRAMILLQQRQHQTCLQKTKKKKKKYHHSIQWKCKFQYFKTVAGCCIFVDRNATTIWIYCTLQG